MSIFGPPNIQKLVNKYDYAGLIKAAHYPRDPDIRWQAIKALIGDKMFKTFRRDEHTGEIISLLVDRAKIDQDTNIRNAALQGLITIGPMESKQTTSLAAVELGNLLNHYISTKQDSLASVTIEALLQFRTLKVVCPHIPADLLKNLVVLLPRQISQGKLQAASQTGLLLMKSESVDAIAAILKPLPQATRLELFAIWFKELPNAAAKVARSLGFWETVPLLMKNLSHNNPEVATALAALGAKEALLPLLDILKVGHHPSNFPSELEAVGQLGDASTVGLIFARIKNIPEDEPMEMEIALLTALGKRDSTILMSAFREHLSPREWEALLMALGAVKDANTVPFILTQAQRNPSAAFLPDLMSKFKDNRFAPFLASYLGDQNSTSPGAAVSALGDLSDPVVVPALIKAVHGNSVNIAKSAAVALEKQYKNKSIREADKLMIINTANQINKKHADTQSHNDEGDKGAISDCTHSDFPFHFDNGPRIQI
jgi:HEAT repeat protein